MDRLTASMDDPRVKLGFAEEYTNDWRINAASTVHSVGHIIKTAWCLGRVYQIQPDPRYKAAARRLLRVVWDQGLYDREYGGPYSSFDWAKGMVTDRQKDYWMLEQGFTGGIVNYFLADNDEDRQFYLRMADESLDFFQRYLVDKEYGEIYSQTSPDGGTVTNPAKGDPFKACYHSQELGYYIYLYGNLFYRNKPVTLYYKFAPERSARDIRLTPLAVRDDKLSIVEVSLNGKPFMAFEGARRTLHLDANQGGIFRVTFAGN